MAWEPTAYTAIGVVAACLFFGIVAGGWKHRVQAAAKPFLALMFALGLWALVYGIQLGFTTREAQMTWQRLSFLVGGPVPMLWLVFTLQYTGREAWLTRPVRALVVLDPFVFGMLAVTNPLHGLVWRDATFVVDGSLHVLDLVFGVGYFLHVALAYVVTPLGFGLLLYAVATSALYRTQAALVVLGSTPPFVMNVAYTFGLDLGLGLPTTVDFTPFAFIVTGPLLALALFRFDLLQRVPVARERVLSEAEDGFVVLDEDGEVVTANRVGEAVMRGEAGSDGATRRDCTDLADGESLQAVVDGQRRIYDVSRSPLADRRGRTVGHVVQFRNVTDRETYEQRLEVSNRVLRHNLRNRMNVIVGLAERVARSDDPEVAAAGRGIGGTAADLLDTGEKVRTMIETAQYAQQSTEPVDLAERIGPVVDDLRTEFPAATVETDLPAGVAVAVPDGRLLTIAVGNLVENALEHHDGDDPWARVTVDPDGPDGRVVVRVADDGPGIPEDERAVLAEGAETPLRHGSGLGLWLVYWSVTAAGGEVRFEANEPRGSVVSLLLRPAG